MTTVQSNQLQDSVALVTGASGGLGAAVATALAQAGARVVLVGRSAERLRPLADSLPGPGAIAVGDVSAAGEADRLVEQVAQTHGDLDVLVNAAGGATVGGLLDVSDAQWQADVDLKLLGYARTMRAAARSMRRKGGGSIVNVAGLAGHEPYHLLTVPSVVNAGVLALTKAAADELAPYRIRVNAVSPNAAETGLGERMVGQLAAAQGTTPAAVRDYLVGATPLGRLVQSADVAAAVLFYASPLSRFVTGTSLPLDGGAHRAIA